MLTFSFVFLSMPSLLFFVVLIGKELVTMEEVSVFLTRKIISSLWDKQMENLKSINLSRVGMRREC